MAPRTKPTAQGKPNRKWVAAATAIVVNTTQPIAKSAIGRRLKRNSFQLIFTASQ